MDSVAGFVGPSSRYRGSLVQAPFHHYAGLEEKLVASPVRSKDQRECDLRGGLLDLGDMADREELFHRCGGSLHTFIEDVADD